MADINNILNPDDIGTLAKEVAKETVQSAAQESIKNIKAGEIGGISGVKSGAQEKLASIIVDKAQNLIVLLIPQITTLATEIGIEAFGTLNVKIPDLCLPKERLLQLATLRDNLYNKLNSTSQIINNLSKPVDVINQVAITTSKTVATLNIARAASLTALELTPPTVPVPGPIIAGISKLDDLLNFLNPKVIKAQVAISSISLALDFANQVLAKILSFFKPIDDYIKKCLGNDAAPPAIDSYLAKAQDDFNKAQETPETFGTYKGFILDVVQEPFSPTVNKIKAVAKNNQGIILLQTPFSFATDPQPLIEQLKLIIDTNDLKAY